MKNLLRHAMLITESLMILAAQVRADNAAAKKPPKKANA